MLSERFLALYFNVLLFDLNFNLLTPFGIPTGILQHFHAYYYYAINRCCYFGKKRNERKLIIKESPDVLENTLNCVASTLLGVFNVLQFYLLKKRSVWSVLGYNQTALTTLGSLSQLVRSLKR